MFQLHCVKVFWLFLNLHSTFLHRQKLLLQVRSVCSLSWKVVPWRKALTSGVSRQRRSWRRRKQSSACFCFTSPDMAWPLHRSPLRTMGFLLKYRLCMCVCLCVRALFPDKIFCSNQYAQHSLGQVSKVFSLERLILMFRKCYCSMKIVQTYWNSIRKMGTHEAEYLFIYFFCLLHPSNQALSP